MLEYGFKYRKGKFVPLTEGGGMEINMYNKRKYKSDKKGLNIIIVGCGKVGETLAEQLSKEGHDITLIDKNASKIQDLINTYDVMGFVGNGASFSVQMEAGIEQADLLIAVTGSDELNLLCCIVAKRVGDCAVIARVRTPDYSDEVGYLQEKLGLTRIINPELEAASEIARILYLPTALGVNPFSRGRVEMVRFKIPQGNMLHGKKIATLGNMNMLICAVERGKEIFIPGGSFEIKEGDIISFIATAKEAKDFLKKIGCQTQQVKDTLIIGGGIAAYYLAKQLLDMNIKVTIIEEKKSRCEELSILLPEAIIINGDGTNPELLKETGIEWVESFVPLTGMDEENIILTLHAQMVSKAKIVTEINRINFNNVMKRLQLDSVIYPKYIIAETIIAYVRAKKNSMNSNIETLYHLFDSRVEAIEFLVTEESNVTHVPLKMLRLKNNLLVTCINRGGQIIIPGGEDCVEVGDTVIVVTTHTGFHDIQDILK